MKTSTIPALRVDPELRKAAERVLEEGETLSSFVLESVRKSIDERRAQAEFIARGLAAERRAKRSGSYVPAADVLAKLGARLKRARHKSAGRG